MDNGNTAIHRGVRKVPSACQRCRRQKLKCDVNRPCTLCSRAGVDCQPATSTHWRVYQHRDSEEEPATKRVRTVADNSTETARGPAAEEDAGSQFPRPKCSIPSDEGRTIEEREIPVAQAWNSSSTISLVDRAFTLHNAAPNCLPATNAIPGGHPGELRPDNSEPEEESRPRMLDDLNSRSGNRLLPRLRSFTQPRRSASAELAMLLPSRQAAALLVDTYFDRVHWFMLIFHQDYFRRQWPMLYNHSSGGLSNDHSIGFISTFLMVLAIGLQYIGDHRRRLLSSYGIDADDLKERIFSVVRAKLLDIISVGSLEAVQTCVLLGTYYLYHGSPRLAWPVCGCGLRIAQALGLHRKISIVNSESSSVAADVRKKNEARKRSWWAIYEIETFCSMTYGYPHSIRDADCDVEPLDPSAKSEDSQSPSSFDQPLSGEATLLSYKYYMSKLSRITKNVLTELYHIGPNPAGSPKLNNPASSPQHTLKTVSQFDTRLKLWHKEIPLRLRFESGVAMGAGYSSPDELDRDIGGSGPTFENHIYQLQGLALKLGYENARILVHRPLLSYKLVTKSSDPNVSSTNGSGSTQVDPYHLCLQACHEAAISISDIISNPIVDIVSATYAASFVSIHVFTAGVTLGILSSIEPLTPRSREAKVGLHRLMAIQEKLRTRSVLAVQGLEILQRLTKLVMEKELNTMLDLSKPMDSKLPLRESTSNATDGSDYLQDAQLATRQNDPASNPTSSGSFMHAAVSVIPEMAMPVTGPFEPDDTTTDNCLQYIENPALSEALYDFDQALLSHSSQCPPRSEDLHDSSFLPPPDDEFAILEQTWIWGWDNLPPYE